MQVLFSNNCKVREQWFELCQQIPVEELGKKREGGLGSILHTLFHIVDFEQAWINGLQGLK